MKKILIVIIAFTAFFVTSCENEGTSKKKAESVNLTKEELQSIIKNTEKEVFDVPPEKINQSKVKFLASYYVKYAAYGDSLAPEYLYKAAGIYMNTHEPVKAIKALDEIINKYPSYNKTENCYFLRGFVYDDKLKDTANARKYYKEYLIKYPNGDFSKDTKLLLENMGKSNEEIFKELEDK